MTIDAAATLRRSAAHVLVDDVAMPVLHDDQAHHVFRVLRVRDGESVTVTDGAGRWRECRATGTAVDPIADVESIARRASPLTVAFAIPKQDRPEWIVQKLTEIGIDRIVVLHAERSVVRWTPDRAAKHLSRLRRVAAEAMQQCRGVWLPDLSGPVGADEVLPHVVAAEPGGRPLTASDTGVAIGPEGGWTPSELALAPDTATIGPTVLRVETAAIVAGAYLRRPMD